MMLFKDAFSGALGKNIQCMFFDPERTLLNGAKKHSRYVANFLKKVNARPHKDIQLFSCACKKPCLCVPIKQGNSVYGYAIALHLKREPDKKDLACMRAFLDVALREFQKEQELTRLYDTIRPRAIALSTIHTIHRLLTSTLDMDELIERIARLTLQVVRARSCSIMLLDDAKRFLVPTAVIDLKNNKSGPPKKHRKIKVGAGILGKVARTGRTILSRRMICVPLVEEDIIGIICSKDKADNAPFNKFDMEILLTLAEQAVIAIKNSQMYEEQKRMAYGSIKSLAALLDAKSPQAYTHSEQFVQIALAIAEEMKLPREEIRNLRYATLLPDTGKFSIPDEILKKPGGLSKEEFTVIKKQHLESLKILEPLEFLKPVMPIITYHHERYDGTGYPEGLRREEIPVGARIMAVVDAFEAMVSSRPYKDSNASISQAIKEIKNNKGSQFDPEVVDAFIAVSEKPEFKKPFNI